MCERRVRQLVGLPLGLAAVPAISSMAKAHDGGDHPGYGMHGMMWDGGWMMMGPITMLIFLVIAVVVIVMVVRWLGGSGSNAGGGSAEAKSALAILQERFARGEIDAEEYQERKRLLEE